MRQFISIKFLVTNRLPKFIRNKVPTEIFWFFRYDQYFSLLFGTQIIRTNIFIWVLLKYGMSNILFGISKFFFNGIFRHIVASTSNIPFSSFGISTFFWYYQFLSVHKNFVRYYIEIFGISKFFWYDQYFFEYMEIFSVLNRNFRYDKIS